MKRSGMMRLLGIVGGILVSGLTLLALGIFLFFRYMSEGELHSRPPGGKVTIAFSDKEEVQRVMLEICQETEVIAQFRRTEYQELLDRGTLALVPDKTPVLLEEHGSRGNGLTLSRFKFEKGPWQGRAGWTCPNSTVWKRAYP